MACSPAGTTARFTPTSPDGTEHNDLAALDELDRIWLAHVCRGALSERSTPSSSPRSRQPARHPAAPHLGERLWRSRVDEQHTSGKPRASSSGRGRECRTCLRLRVLQRQGPRYPVGYQRATCVEGHPLTAANSYYPPDEPTTRRCRICRHRRKPAGPSAEQADFDVARVG